MKNHKNVATRARTRRDSMKVQTEPQVDLFESLCADSKDPDKCRLFVERLELAALNIDR